MPDTLDTLDTPGTLDTRALLDTPRMGTRAPLDTLEARDRQMARDTWVELDTALMDILLSARLEFRDSPGPRRADSQSAGPMGSQNSSPAACPEPARP